MLRLIFRSPWYVPFVLALGLFWVANFFYQDYRHDEAAKALALQQGPPAAVSLNAFDPARDTHPADEVHVTGWINVAYNTQLTLTTKRKWSSSDTVRQMFVLFGPDDTTETKTVRAVVLLPAGDVDRFVDDILANGTGFAGDSPVFTLSGTASRSGSMDNVITKAFAANGLSRAPDFRIITIWPATGRAAALAPSTEQLMQLPLVFALLGLLLLFVAGVKFRLAKTISAPASEQSFVRHPYLAPPPVQPQTHATIAEAAIKQREADAIAAYFAAPPGPSSRTPSVDQAASTLAPTINADAFAAFATASGTASATASGTASGTRTARQVDTVSDLKAFADTFAAFASTAKPAIPEGRKALTPVEQADLALLRADPAVLSHLKSREKELTASFRCNHILDDIRGFKVFFGWSALIVVAIGAFIFFNYCVMGACNFRLSSNWLTVLLTN